MSREALIALTLLGVLFLGGIALWAIRKKASAWADQYQKATEDEARGMAGDYPIIGYRAQRLSWRVVTFILVCVAAFLGLATVLYFEAIRHKVPHMGIDTPPQIEVLIAFGVFTAAIITAFVWYMLKSKSFNPPNPNRLNLTVLLLFFFTIAAVMSFMLFSALAYGEASGIGGRDTGKVYPVSQDPVSYWFLVAIYYSLAVPALSLGLVVAAKLMQPQRSPSEADLMKKAVERVSKPAGPLSDDASDPKTEMGDSPYEPFERLSEYAAIVYIAGVLIALYVYWSRDWDLPPRHRIAAVLFAPVFVFFGLLAIYTGEVGLKVRSKTPVGYWARVAVMLLLGIGLLLIGIGVIGA